MTFDVISTTFLCDFEPTVLVWVNPSQWAKAYSKLEKKNVEMKSKVVKKPSSLLFFEDF